MEKSSDYSKEPILGLFGRAVAELALGVGLIALQVVEILGPERAGWSNAAHLLLAVTLIGVGARDLSGWRRQDASEPPPRIW
jgi:hypothetical protein